MRRFAMKFGWIQVRVTHFPIPSSVVFDARGGAFHVYLEPRFVLDTLRGLFSFFTLFPRTWILVIPYLMPFLFAFKASVVMCANLYYKISFQIAFSIGVIG